MALATLTRDEKKLAENMALDLLIKHDETNLPVDPTRLAGEEGYSVIYTDMIGNITGLLVPEDKTIMVDRTLDEQRSRFVIAHELGHVCLGHKGHRSRGDCVDSDMDGDDSFKKELAAEQFARTLLMPKPYLEKAISLFQSNNKAFSSRVEYISYVFNVTEQKARMRLEECGFATA